MDQATAISLLRSRARVFGLPESLVLAVARRESGINPNVRDGSAGEVGIMQVKPSTAADFGVDNLRDPSQAIEAGVRYLAWLRDKYRGDWSKVAAAYNGGPGNVDRGTVSADARKYSHAVLADAGLGGSSVPRPGGAAGGPAFAFLMLPEVEVNWLMVSLGAAAAALLYLAARR